MLKKMLVFLIVILITVSTVATVSFANDVPDGWIIVPCVGTEYREYNLSDVSLILKYIANWDVFISREYFQSYDMDNNNNLNLSDVSLILKRIARHSD